MNQFVELHKEGKVFIVNIDSISMIVEDAQKKEAIDIFFKGEPDHPLRLTKQTAKPLLDAIKRQFTIYS